MSFLFKNREGQIPIDESIRKFLRPKHIQDMTELYELESENIALGIAWSQSMVKDHLDYMVWLELHKHMLKDIWKFAGTPRDVELANPDYHMPFNIRPSLKELEQDLKIWIEHQHPFEELIAKFHERLLTIHPFRDGNGRWSRVLTELVCGRQNYLTPSWGSKTIPDEEERRMTYIESIKKARHHFEFEELIKFIWG